MKIEGTAQPPYERVEVVKYGVPIMRETGSDTPKMICRKPFDKTAANNVLLVNLIDGTTRLIPYGTLVRVLYAKVVIES
jgi:hypothetical protein